MNFKVLAESVGLEEDEYMELIDLFIDMGMSDLEKLQSAVNEGNSENVADAAHSMKGAAGNLGMMDFYESASKIEAGAREGNLQGVSEKLQALNESLNELAVLAKK